MITQAGNSSYKGNSFEGGWLLEKRTKIVKDIKAAACSGKDEDKHNRNISLCLLGIGENLSFEAVQVSVELSKQYLSLCASLSWSSAFCKYLSRRADTCRFF